MPPRAVLERPLRSLMRNILLAAVLVFAGFGFEPAHAQRRSQTGSITPQELARIWDAERVSPAAPPLMTHDDVVARLKAVVAASRV